MVKDSMKRHSIENRTAATISRRTVLLRGIEIPLAGAVMLTLGACSGGKEQQASAACVDPDQLDQGQVSMRESVHYTDKSPNPQQVCSACAFFRTAEASGACAPCDILHTPVSASGHCESWSARV
jgi:hypothetical protein